MPFISFFLRYKEVWSRKRTLSNNFFHPSPLLHSSSSRRYHFSFIYLYCCWNHFVVRLFDFHFSHGRRIAESLPSAEATSDLRGLKEVVTIYGINRLSFRRNSEVFLSNFLIRMPNSGIMKKTNIRHLANKYSQVEFHYQNISYERKCYANI